VRLLIGDTSVLILNLSIKKLKFETWLKSKANHKQRTKNKKNFEMSLTMTPDQFFDALDELFGKEDGYICHLDRIKKLKEENEKLEEENSNLKAEIESRDEIDEKATEWIEEVFDSDTWDPVEVGKWVKELKQELEEEKEKLKEQLQYEQKVSFWRMCESYNGFHKNTNIRHPEWIEEMNEMIEDRWENNSWCSGTVEELQKGYLEWVGGYQTEDEDEDE